MLHVPKNVLENPLSSYLEADRQLSSFIGYVGKLVCPQQCHIQYEGDSMKCRTHWVGHNKGALVRIFADGPLLGTDAIKRWASDTEHGLLHGLMTAFFALSSVYPDGIPQSCFDELDSDKINTPISFEERLVVSCILHDFVKGGLNQEPHDDLLNVWFPTLCKSAYTHANPPKIDPLVIGDRWELLRFEDWQTWVKMEMLSGFTELRKKAWIEFHRFIRPALAKLIVDKHDVWFRHSPERTHIQTGKEAYAELGADSIYPPEGHWLAREDDSDYFAIETGCLPITACLIHGYLACQKDNPSMYSPYGLVSLNTVKSFRRNSDSLMQRNISPCARVTPDTSPGAGLKAPPWPTEPSLKENWNEVIKKEGFGSNAFISREHLCMKPDILLKEWLFLFDDNAWSSDIELKNNGAYKLQRDWHFLKHSGGLIRLQLANQILQITGHLEALLLALRS